MYLLKRGPKDLVELTTWAQQYLIAPVSQIIQKKTCAMVAKSHEDGEEAFTGMNVERPRSSGNSKKSSVNGLISDFEPIYSAACHAQSNYGQIYFGVGKLNGRPVKVLRDTGCTGMIVDRALIPAWLDGDTRQFRLAAAGRPHCDRCAINQCLSRFPVLQRTLQSDMCQFPRIPCDNW